MATVAGLNRRLLAACRKLQAANREMLGALLDWHDTLLLIEEDALDLPEGVNYDPWGELSNDCKLMKDEWSEYEEGGDIFTGLDVLDTALFEIVTARSRR